MTPVFTLLSANSSVTAIIGAPPSMRCFDAGSIPETPTPQANIPCVTQQQISGMPANMLAAAPSIDYTYSQINVWALTRVQARTLMELVRDTLEANGANVMMSAPRDMYETETKRFGSILEFAFWINR